MKRKSTGTLIPSFKPLSTFRASLILDGTAGFVTTALPSAASVGASMVAKIPSSIHEKSLNRKNPLNMPSKIVSGKPINKRRIGMAAFFLRTVKLVLDASLNKTSARANSAMMR